MKSLCSGSRALIILLSFLMVAADCFSAFIFFPAAPHAVALAGEHGGGDHGGDHGDSGDHDNGTDSGDSGGATGGSGGSGDSGDSGDGGGDHGGGDDAGAGDGGDGHDGGEAEADHDDFNEGDFTGADRENDDHHTDVEGEPHDLQEVLHDGAAAIHDLGSSIISCFSGVNQLLHSLFLPDAPEPDGDFEAGIVLAVDADHQTLAELEKQGLVEEERLRLDHIGVQVSRLRVPPGQEAAVVRDRLQQQGHDAIMLNHYYELEGTAAAADDYPGGTIGWSPPCRACGRGARIGMVDGYVNIQVPVLRGQRINRRMFVGSQRASGADHGTAIASLLVGRCRKDFCGLLPEAGLWAAVAFGTDDGGKTTATAVHVARALDWLTGQGVQVINLSFSGPDNPLLRRAVEKILACDIALVAAAGNQGEEQIELYPAAYPGVLAVTAVDRHRRLYRAAGRGDYVSFAAPGVRIPIPDGSGRVRYKSGTSYAAPYCTALAARYLLHGNGGRSGKEVMAILRENVVDLGAPGKDPLFGWGLVQGDPRWWAAKHE